jgi:hypothetical protein
MEKIIVKYGTFLISIVIFVILGVQTLAVVFRSGNGKYWPFIDYPMYSWSHREGDRIAVLWPLFAIYADKSEKQIFPQDLGLTVFQFEDLLVPDILSAAQKDKKELQPEANFIWHNRYSWRECIPEEAEARLKALLKLYEQQHGKHIISLRLENYPYILTKEGPKRLQYRSCKS